MKYGLSIAVVLLTAFLPGAASADGRSQGSFADRFSRLQLARGYSLDETVSGVRRRYPGKVLSADTIDQGGRPVHRIRILNDEGRVRGLRFDGNTGKPLPRPDRRPQRR